jgi:hypothetical protein
VTALDCRTCRGTGPGKAALACATCRFNRTDADRIRLLRAYLLNAVPVTATEVVGSEKKAA